MNAKSLDKAKEGDLFNIRAQNRLTGKREFIHIGYSRDKAIAFEPAVWEKRVYRYFRVVKQRKYKRF